MTPLRPLWIALASLACLCAAPCALAQDAQPRRVALLVGNWDYNGNSQFDDGPSEPFASDLSNPCRDIERLRPVLEYNRFQVHEYCNNDRNKFEASVDAFSRATADLPKGSIVFVYYAGHGIQYLGQAFALPVLIKFDLQTLQQKHTKERLKFFKDNANSIARLLDRLNSDDGIALVVALDNCRNSPFEESADERVDDEAVYNNAVSIRTRPNTLIQYATTAGDRAGDRDPDDSGNSPYAMTLSRELAKGGDIGDVMSRVDVEIYKRYDSGKLDAYTESNAGPAFIALKHAPERALAAFVPAAIDAGVAAASPAGGAPPAAAAAVRPTAAAASAAPAMAEPRSAGAAPVRRKQIVRNVYDGTSLDIIWCEGPGEEERYRFAAWIAGDLAARAKELGVGRIQVKPLAQDKNENGRYNVYRNLMRYDIEHPDERKVLRRIAAAYPQGHFLPQRGIGVGGKPTPNYVSAFVCERSATAVTGAGAG
ncbi:Uncharacterized protein, contains caspase domain [Lysobacter sp. yr284]|uniref:caspase family protein n=1 Tax=Lysobacter sp. yr284 TaxID=1761791 RepID=UPI00089731B8|nr:caspase family protein [Lysobacter sp. yr284]SDY23069.1 Uncharacterized protein, contains caspase domain [Lysobacter sp. yr284]